jgi:hypothetical protein
MCIFARRIFRQRQESELARLNLELTLEVRRL